MVKGFDKFKQYFAPHSDSFIVIGDPTGNMEDYLLAFRRHFDL